MGKLFLTWDLICRFKYVLAFLFFAILLGVAGDDSLWVLYQHEKELDGMRAQLKEYQDSYAQDTKRLQELSTNPRFVERFAREEYHMKRANEDVFLIIHEDEVKDSIK